MPGSTKDDPQLSNREATAKINEIARNPASRIIFTNHSIDRQAERVISNPQCYAALEAGVVSQSRMVRKGSKMTCAYSVEFTDEFGPIRIVTRIVSSKALLVISCIDRSN